MYFKNYLKTFRRILSLVHLNLNCFNYFISKKKTLVFSPGKTILNVGVVNIDIDLLKYCPQIKS